MLNYEENMIRDIKNALSVAMRRRKQFCVNWDDERGTDRELIVFATDERDAVGQLFYKLAQKTERGEGVQGVHVTNVEFINYIDDSGQMISALDRKEIEKRERIRFTVPFATANLKKDICDFIDWQIIQRKEDSEK